MRHNLSAALLLALAIAAPAAAQAPEIQVEDAWARATAPSAQAGGVFLTLTDHGAGDRMVSASTPVAATAELHESVDDNGVMRMRSVPALPLPTGTAVQLKPGSYHIMLTGLKRQLKPGETFPISLTFEHAPPVTVTVTVQSAGASGKMHTHGP